MGVWNPGQKLGVGRRFCGPSDPGENLRPPSPTLHHLVEALSHTCEQQQRRRGDGGEGRKRVGRRAGTEVGADLGGGGDRKRGQECEK